HKLFFHYTAMMRLSAGFRAMRIAIRVGVALSPINGFPGQSRRKGNMIKISLKGLSLSVFTLMLLSAIPFASDPASPIPTVSTNDHQPGSVLVYNFYSSDVADPGQETKFTIANTNTSQSVVLHLFFISGTDCTSTDVFLCLTENQTASFLASDLDPGVTGYMVAVAVDAPTGVPISFNFLIGDAHVKLISGHEAKLNAEAIQALFQGPLEAGAPVFATLDF